jgi:RNA polymerase sigma-70 factor (ECF subfamily)
MIRLKIKKSLTSRKRHIKKLIEELPSDQKEVLVMRMYQDMSFKEILKLQGLVLMSLGRMRYALMNLRKVIDKHQIVLTN